MWNMQSGLKRKTFKVGPCPQAVIEPLNVTSKPKASERCITGLATDALNRLVIASTLDGTINVSLYINLSSLKCSSIGSSSLISTLLNWTIHWRCPHLPIQ